MRDLIVAACERQAPEQLAAVADATGGGDTVFAIDRVGEEALRAAFAAAVPEDEPVHVIAEGLTDPLVLPQGASERDCRWRLLVDPIDGSRGLMYQKRSAWILSGLAPNRGPKTRLADIVLAVQTEIPLLKQHRSDQLWAVRGRGVQARRFDRLAGTEAAIVLRPSREVTIAQGFATVVRFFPGARDVLAAIDDDIALALAPASPGTAGCFEDQYASTGGQLYELMAGHDRFVADLRPLVQPLRAARGQPRGLCCHPYDLSTALIAEEAGVILSDANGAPLDAPLDLATDVAWIGYANKGLRAAIEPVLKAAVLRHGL
jgi:hypothetical protein